MIERMRVMGAPVDRLTIEGARAICENCFVNGDRPAVVLAMNPEKVYALKEDPDLARLFEQAMLSIPDGIGVVAAMIKHGVRATRVPGIDLAWANCETAARLGKGVFLFGASPESNSRAAIALERGIPGLRIVGRIDGYSGLTDEDVASEISESGAELLLIALGSPRQERWVLRNIQNLIGVRIVQGVGGSFDVWSGEVVRAPRILQVVGLEWLFRLLCQPSRFRRQKVLARFAWDVFVMQK